MLMFVLTTENLGYGYGSWQAAEIQITHESACGVHFKQCRYDDTWLFVKQIIKNWNHDHRWEQ